MDVNTYHICVCSRAQDKIKTTFWIQTDILRQKWIMYGEHPYYSDNKLEICRETCRCETIQSKWRLRCPLWPKNVKSYKKLFEFSKINYSITMDLGHSKFLPDILLILKNPENLKGPQYPIWEKIIFKLS